ncbi:MAG TPA: c-type cytochrome [Polyangiaceae bacterium]|nr:c-type cytochrome [Polyangiaceae bacterium]
MGALPRSGALAAWPGVALAAALALAACKESARRDPPPAPSAGAPATQAPALGRVVGDPMHGKQLIADLQCNRCHDGTGAAPPPANKQCVQCHADIVAGKFKASPALLSKWRPIVADLTDAPSLTGTDKRLRRDWVASYLAKPHDLRPGLAPSMPRLALEPSQIADLAAYLVLAEAKPEAAPQGDLEAGRRVVESKGCITCHAMSGVPGLGASALPVSVKPEELARGRRLAPDLRYVRERQLPSQTAQWLRDPIAVKADSAMPRIPLTEAEVRDVTAFLHTRPLDAVAGRPPVARPALLTRKVTFAEVDKRVFHRTCWHCHSEPDYAIGDGGPGNSGGFGFKPRGLNLSDFNGIAAGFLDDKGERASVFAPGPDGVPRLVASLLARHAEEAGAETGPVRGMPLAYPPLALEDIQLVDTWISQGRPR